VNPYDRIARVYAGPEPGEDDPALRARCRELFVERLRGRRVLEVGCGPGVDAAKLADAGLEVTATDACEEFVAIVRERFPQVRARVMDMTAPDASAETYDGIWSFASFIHVPRSAAHATLEGFARLLAPGGVLFLALVRATLHREYVIEDWGGVPGNAALFTCWEPDELAALLGECGFGEVEELGVRSELYERLPRLVERGASLFQIVARRGGPGTRG
jgi:SAM-dependent methyltransferase